MIPFQGFFSFSDTHCMIKKKKDWDGVGDTY